MKEDSVSLMEFQGKEQTALLRAQRIEEIY